MQTADPLQLFTLAFTDAKDPFLRPTNTKLCKAICGTGH